MIEYELNDNRLLGEIKEDLNEIAGNFDISRTDNIALSLFLSRLETISIKLGNHNAVKEINRIKDIITLKAFHNTRITTFTNPEQELNLWSKTLDKATDFKDIMYPIFFEHLNDKIESDYMFVPGVGILITGNRRLGKTDFSLLLCEIGILNECNVITNIYCEDDDIIVCIDDIQLLRALSKSRDRLSIVNFDELAVFASSKASGALFNRYLDSFNFLVRKFNALMISIVQREMSALATIRETIDYHIHKFTKQTAQISYKNLVKDIKYIPATRIKFDSESISSFDFKLDIDRVFKEMSGKPIKLAYDILDKILDNPEPYYNEIYLNYLSKNKKNKMREDDNSGLV